LGFKTRLARIFAYLSAVTAILGALIWYSGDTNGGAPILGIGLVLFVGCAFLLHTWSGVSYEE